MAGEYDSDYQIINFDLALNAGRKQIEVVQDGRPIAAVTIVALPPAAVGNVFLRFGPNGDPIPLRQEALTIGRSPARSNGLFADVAAAQVGILTLMIGIDLAVNA